MAVTGEKIVFRTLGFTLSTLGSVPSNVFKVPKTTVNTFDGTESQGHRIKSKVRKTRFFFPVCGVVCVYHTALVKEYSQSLLGYCTLHYKVYEISIRFFSSSVLVPHRLGRAVL